MLKRLVGDRDLCRRLENAPVAYVTELVKRREVLGLDRAIAELDELLDRRRHIDERTEVGE